jgi:hypothetical protein
MCWNEQVSILSFLAMLFIVRLVLQQKPRPNLRWQAFSVLSFSFVQLLESAAWVAIHSNNAWLNGATTRLILVVITKLHD